MNKRKMGSYLRTLFILWSVLFLNNAVHAAVIINVPADQPTIQAAINNADDGDTVFVADGIYYELINFGTKHITVKSVNGAAVTTIDGMGKYGSVVTFKDNSTGSVLEGFTIKNGKSSFDVGGGGGIFLDSSSPTINNCTVSENDTDEGVGAGIYCIKASSPKITNCTISKNPKDTLPFSGGGIYCLNSSPTITNCTISIMQQH